MGKITSKFQVTVPKAIADHYRMRPGDEIEWIPAGDTIRIVPAGAPVPLQDPAARARLFDQATERNRKRTPPHGQRSEDRGWTREDLYARGRSR